MLYVIHVKAFQLLSTGTIRTAKYTKMVIVLLSVKTKGTSHSVIPLSITFWFTREVVKTESRYG